PARRGRAAGARPADGAGGGAPQAAEQLGGELGHPLALGKGVLVVGDNPPEAAVHQPTSSSSPARSSTRWAPPGPGGRPKRPISTGVMPAARAPATSLTGWSPTCRVAAGSAPASSRAALKIRGSGLATPR